MWGMASVLRRTPSWALGNMAVLPCMLGSRRDVAAKALPHSSVTSSRVVRHMRHRSFSSARSHAEAATARARVFREPGRASGGRAATVPACTPCHCTSSTAASTVKQYARECTHILMQCHPALCNRRGLLTIGRSTCHSALTRLPSHGRCRGRTAMHAGTTATASGQRTQHNITTRMQGWVRLWREGACTRQGLELFANDVDAVVELLLLVLEVAHGQQRLAGDVTRHLVDNGLGPACELPHFPAQPRRDLVQCAVQHRVLKRHELCEVLCHRGTARTGACTAAEWCGIVVMACMDTVCSCDCACHSREHRAEWERHDLALLLRWQAAVADADARST